MKKLYNKTLSRLTILISWCILLDSQLSAGEYSPLFPDDGIPKDWVVRAWSDVGKAGPEGAQWIVEQGVLNGGGARGSWLISKKDYTDFELSFDFKLGPQGNSGWPCALQALGILRLTALNCKWLTIAIILKLKIRN